MAIQNNPNNGGINVSTNSGKIPNHSSKAAVTPSQLDQLKENKIVPNVDAKDSQVTTKIEKLKLDGIFKQNKNENPFDTTSAEKNHWGQLGFTNFLNN